MRNIHLFALIFMSMTLMGAQALAEDDPWGYNSPFGAEISAQTAFGVNKEDPTSYTDFGAMGSVEFVKNLTGSINLGVAKEWSDLRKTLFKDLWLQLAHKEFYSLYGARLGGSIRGIFSTSKASRDRGQIFALKPGLNITKDFGRFLLGYDFATTFFFNKFTTARNKAPNKKYGFTNTLIAGYQLIPNLRIDTYWTLMNFFTEQGTEGGEFSFVQQLTYSGFDPLDVSLGHSNGGRQYLNGGRDSNIGLFDVDGSEIYMTFSVGF